MSMRPQDILDKLGEKIFDRILGDTSPGDEFLLSIIDPCTFDLLKKETADFQQVENALKCTGRYLECFSRRYVAITIATLQTSLVYNVDINEISNRGFCSKLRWYYPNLEDDSSVQKYFDDIEQGKLWEKVKNKFANENRYLIIPEPPNRIEKGPGKNVQFPKSQQLIRWNELVEYADKFKRINLEDSQIFSFDDFCEIVDISGKYDFSSEEYRTIQKIVFSFYNNWDGRSSKEIKNQGFIRKNKKERQVSHAVPDVQSKIRLKIQDERIHIWIDEKKALEEELLSRSQEKNKVVFAFDEDYEDWVHITKRKKIQNEDRLLVLENKSYRFHDHFAEFRHENLEMECFRVYVFETCDFEIASFIDFYFDKKIIYATQGGIKALGNYSLKNNVLGSWYDFALPKAKINLPLTSVYIDSEEIVVTDGQIDLSNVTIKKNNTKYLLKQGEHSLKCKDVSPAYFYVEGSNLHSNPPINCGWKISPSDLRPINHNENPDIMGLKILKTRKTAENNHLRPFLLQAKRLQNRIGNDLDNKIKSIETRRYYGC